MDSGWGSAHPTRRVSYSKQEEVSVYMSHWGGASAPHRAGGRRLPSAPHPTHSPVCQRLQQSRQWEACTAPPVPPRLPLFPMKVGSSHALHLPVACHSGVYTRIRIPLLWRINLQECFKQSSSMQSQECCPNQGQH